MSIKRRSIQYAPTVVVRDPSGTRHEVVTDLSADELCRLYNHGNGATGPVPVMTLEERVATEREFYEANPVDSEQDVVTWAR